MKNLVKFLKTRDGKNKIAAIVVTVWMTFIFILVLRAIFWVAFTYPEQFAALAFVSSCFSALVFTGICIAWLDAQWREFKRISRETRK